MKAPLIVTSAQADPQGELVEEGGGDVTEIGRIATAGGRSLFNSSSYDGYEDEDDDPWERDVKPGHARIWWTTWVEAQVLTERFSKEPWPGYLRDSLLCRLFDRPTDEQPGAQTRVALMSTQIGTRRLKLYCAAWFDQDGVDDLFNDACRGGCSGLKIYAVPPHIKSGMIGVIVRESHVKALPSVGVVTHMDRFEVDS